ncbi:DUF2634 domain-containing protein [Lachnospiraceae bacterium 62-35]
MTILPEGAGLNTSLQYKDCPTNTYIIDWSSRQISGMNSGLEAMRQAIEIILQNERFRWQIYNSNFGSELEDLAGEEYDYIISELPRRIEDAFSIDDRILSVDNYDFSDNGDGSMTVSFHIRTVFGTISEEVIV